MSRTLSINNPFNARRATGFTLIELIVVIVILGILAATAMPKFMDMRREARIAALKGLEGGIRSGLETILAAYLTQRGQYTSQPSTPAMQRIPTSDGSSVILWDNDLIPDIHDALTEIPPPVIQATIDGIGSLMKCTATPVRYQYDCQGFVASMDERNGPMGRKYAFFAPAGMVAPHFERYYAISPEQRCYLAYSHLNDNIAGLATYAIGQLEISVVTDGC